MKLVVTGGSGAIGSAFLEHVRDRSMDMEVRILTRSMKVADDLCRRFPLMGVAVHDGWQGQEAAEAMRNADVLLHLAWSSVPGTAALDPAADLKENVVQGSRLLDMAAAGGVGRVVFVSSGGTVYGTAIQLPITEDHPLRPITAYGVSKLCFEHVLHLHAATHGYGTLVLRPANVYGVTRSDGRPQGVVEHWMRALAQGRPIEMWNVGKTTRDLVHMEDMVEVLTRSVLYRGADVVLNVGTGRGTTLAELAHELQAVAGIGASLVHAPGPHGAVDSNILSTERLGSVLGHVPEIKLREGLERLWRSYRPL